MKIFLYDPIINSLFSYYNDFPLHLESIWIFQMFHTSSSLSKYTYIHSNLWLKYMKLKDPPHTATHNGLYTSTCTMSNKLVVHPYLAYKRWCHFISDLLIICLATFLASVVMDVISPTRFIRVHPSSMNTVIIWTTIVLIIPEQNNNYSNKSWRLGLIPTRNTITLYLFSMRIIPYSFASYLGHCSSCIALFCMTLHTNQSSIQYPRTTLFNKQWIHP